MSETEPTETPSGAMSIFLPSQEEAKTDTPAPPPPSPPKADAPKPVVLSRRQEEDFTPEHYKDADGNPRPGAPSYRLAPLTLRQRNAVSESLTRQGFRTLNWPLRAKAAAAACDRLGLAEEAAQARAISQRFRDRTATGNDILELVLIEEEAAVDPQLAALLADGMKARAEQTFRFATAALRGWSPEVPVEYRRDAQGRVAAEALDELPPSDLDAIGLRAYDLATLSDTTGNS